MRTIYVSSRQIVTMIFGGMRGHDSNGAVSASEPDQQNRSKSQSR